MSSVRWPLVIGLAVAYLASVGAMLVGLDQLRRHVIAVESQPEAIRQWQAWKAETERQAREAGPGARRAVIADEPPSLILLRDHFLAIIGTALLIVSGLFAFIVLVMWSRIRAPRG